MELRDICTKKTYQKDGQEKTFWMKCGTLRITEGGKMFIEFNHLPGVEYFVFEKKEKEPVKNEFGG